MGIKFDESYAQGRSLKNLWTMGADATFCMHVTVTDKELNLRPHKGISWLFNVLALDLEHKVPLGKVNSVEKGSRSIWAPFYKNTVKVKYQTSGGEENTILISLRHADEFVAAIGNKNNKPGP